LRELIVLFDVDEDDHHDPHQPRRGAQREISSLRARAFLSRRTPTTEGREVTDDG
jgi:hypothetical protein